MKSNARLIVTGLLVLGCLLAILFVEPTRVGLGFLRGESFFAGRPSSYWRDQLNDPDVHIETVTRMKAGGAAAVPVVVNLLRQEQGDSWEIIAQRWTLAEVLGTGGPTAVPILIDLLKDSDSQVRSVAAASLGQLGPEAKAAVEPLTAMVGTKEKLAAIKALAGIGPDAKAAVPALTEALKDPSMDVRWSAARALGRIGPNARSALPNLAVALKDPEGQVRILATEAINAIGPEPALVSSLAAVLQDPEPEVQAHALKALYELGPKAQEAVPALETAWKTDNAKVKEAVGKALKQIDPKAAKRLGLE